MKVTLPSDQARKLLSALVRAGLSETGGQLYGELLAPSYFRVTELSVQTRPGTFSRFIVDLVEAARSAVVFFRRTGHDYLRHNYIGEWHSHPSFAVEPSANDSNTMRELVRADDFRGTFAVLMIARLDDNQLRTGAWVYDPDGHEEAITLEVQDGRR